MTWMTFLSAIWKILKNPTVLIGIIGLILCSILYIRGVNFERELVKSKADIVTLNSNLNTAKNNEIKLKDTIIQLNGSQDILKTSIRALQTQVRNERNTTDKWIKFCNDRPDGITQIPINQYKGVIVDEKSNKKYINYINSMFNSYTK